MRLSSFTGLQVPRIPRSLPIRPASHILHSSRRSITSIDSPFQEGDIVLIRPTNRPSADGKLLKPLRPSHAQNVKRGELRHADIIGKQPRDVVRSTLDEAYRVYAPTLDEYVRLSPREVTPIYPCDANLIVSLLDIHVAPHGSGPGAPFEVLEAGTGHGGLTLHLTRALAAANGPPPSLPSLKDELAHERLLARANSPEGPSSAPSSEPSSSAGSDSPPQSSTSEQPSETASSESTSATSPDDSAALDAYLRYKTTRNAILHSCDRSGAFQKHARKVVRGFRRGLYYPHVDFHVCTPTEYVERRLAAQGEAAAADDSGFLSAAILDLPSPEQHLVAVARALRRNAPVALWVPSVTQLCRAMDAVRAARAPLALERVVEAVSGSGGSGGREWDVRRAVVREREKERAKRREVEGEEGAEGGEKGEEGTDETVWVCRPKVGVVTTGGGFIGIWRKAQVQ